MAKYIIAECPEINVKVRGKDSPTTREKALDKFMMLMENGELPTELPDGLSSDQLIEVEQKPDNHSTSDSFEVEEEPVIKAVRELNNLANIKIKMQELHQAAIKARKDLDILFIETPIEQDLDQFKELLKGSFKVLKDFAVASISYKEAKVKAEDARAVLDEALQLNNRKS